MAALLTSRDFAFLFRIRFAPESPRAAIDEKFARHIDTRNGCFDAHDEGVVLPSCAFIRAIASVAGP